MRHLVNAALKYEDFPDDALSGGDGIECLTDFSPFHIKSKKVVSAHLPFCTDWYGVWSGKRQYLKEYDDGFQRYLTYGRSREEIVDNIADAIVSASEMHPAYAILHAGSANVDELFNRDYSETSEEVLLAFCNLMNSVYEKLGRMPVRLMFENQWWPGLRYIDMKEYETLEDNLDFDDWGYCLDTGHLLVTSKRASDDRSNVELLKNLISEIPDNVVDRIDVMHFHTNHSGGYIEGYDRKTSDKVWPLKDRITEGYRYVVGMDRHLPFTVPECVDIAEMINPGFIVHEMGATDIDRKLSDYNSQRSFFRNNGAR